MNIHHAMVVRCPPGKAYAALTQQEQLAVWMGVPNQAQPQVGTQVDFPFGAGQRTLSVEITRLDPDKQVQWLIMQPVWETAAVDQIITWTLEPFEESTLVDFVLGPWPEGEEAYPSVSHKWAMFMMRLKIWLGDLREFTKYPPLPGLQVTA